MPSSSILPPFFPFLPIHSAWPTKFLFLPNRVEFDRSNGPIRMLPGITTDLANSTATLGISSSHRAEVMKASDLKAVGLHTEGRVPTVEGSSPVPMRGDDNSGWAPTMEKIEYCEMLGELARNTHCRVTAFVKGEKGKGTPDRQHFELFDSFQNGENDSATARKSLINKKFVKTIQTIADLNRFLIELMRRGDLETVVHLFSEIQSRRLLPDALTFSVMIRCFCKRNDPDKARILLDDMLRTGFLPNVLTFTILIDCYCKRGRVQKALDFLELMEKIGCDPATRTYNCLLNGLCYVGRVEEAFQLLMKIKYPSEKADIYSFTTVMDGFCKVGRTDEALELLDDAINLGLKPTIVTYNTLLNGYCKEGRPLDGVEFLNAMKESQCQPDIISYNTLLQGLLKWGEIHTALKIYKKMMQLGFQVDERVTNTLLRGVCRQSVAGKGQLNEIEALVGLLNEMSYAISPYTYCLVVQALAHGGEIGKALNNILDMVKQGYSPRLMTYNVILRVLCREGRIDDAILVFVVMMKSGRTPSTFSCTILIDKLNQQKRFLHACGVYALALKRGIATKHRPKEQVRK